jgi:uncharacterized protein YndB with AHSA1/START domain
MKGRRRGSVNDPELPPQKETYMRTSKGYVAKQSIVIHAGAARVWEALTDPKAIQQYLFGTEVITDWKVGSPVIYRGVWEGKTYEDKGKVLQNEPGRLLVSTYWSSMSGIPDRPENYQTVRYELAPENGGTRVTVVQDNNDSQESADHSAQNWKMVLEGMKKVVEEGANG